nr:PREDICTED: cyclic nucleotide-binding domain-containing protein 2-like isoform X2 [Latimeria chalumnae]XP_014349462.1 PREDICTED: cyclic nucleotide-binding domain-containing protein 2-like isoform X2 [Latimeria chalumnae]|eukprot:XP_005988006.2 PREDICTED: cyclic nucleotide-binding domain-containing protein 2-like isoform X2 [Latimeria chalumnae]
MSTQQSAEEDILFDVTIYKAKIQLRLSESTKRILFKKPQERSEQDVRFVLTALRPIKAFADYSTKLQKKVVKVAWYASYEAQQVMVLQGHIPHSFYICLSGSAIVTRRDSANGQVKPAWFLSRGDAFGDQEIMDEACWQSSVIIQEPAEFLCLDREDFVEIFLAGGKKKLSDPEQMEFLRELRFLKGWPVHLIEDNPGKCIVSHYKRGDVILKNSNVTEWIYIIKSGSCSVMKIFKEEPCANQKKLAKRRKEPSKVPINGPEHKKIVLDKYLLHKQKKIKRLTSHRMLDKENIQQETNPSAKDQVHSVTATTSSPRRIWEIQSAGPAEDNKERVEKSICCKRSGPTANGTTSSINKIPSPMKSAHLRARVAIPPAIPQIPEQDEEIRKHPKGLLIQKKVTPIFIVIDTLVKGSVFGLSDFLFADQPSFCIISNGVECLQISKKFYLDNVSEEVIQRLRQQECPYPSDTELRERLQREMEWQVFRKMAVNSTLKHIQLKRKLLQHSCVP